MTVNFPFSVRTNWSLLSNQLSQILDQSRRDEVTILDLTNSNPTACGFSYPQKKILGALNDSQNLIYDPSPRGSIKAREAISQYYRDLGHDVDPEQIFLTASTSEGYGHLFRLLANPKDCVLFPKPSYPLFQFLVDLNDIKLEYYPLSYEDQWIINIDHLKKMAVAENVKAIALVNPNNPTGSFVKEKEISVLNSICKENKLAIISDEVFLDYSFEKSAQRSLVGNKESLTFVLSGISKVLALPQMKLSWIVVSGPLEMRKEAEARLEVIADTYLSVNTPIQNALPKWLLFRQQIQNEIRDRTTENLEFLRSRIVRVKEVHLLNAEGGWYAILKIPHQFSEEEWILSFLKEDHVLVHPGYFFDFEHEPFLVLSLLTEPKVFNEGVDRILRRINRAIS